jgi:hypothetical protein
MHDRGHLAGVDTIYADRRFVAQPGTVADVEIERGLLLEQRAAGEQVNEGREDEERHQ